MKKLLSLLSVLTISGTAVPTTIAASPYQKQEQENNENKKTDNKFSLSLEKNNNFSWWDTASALWEIGIKKAEETKDYLVEQFENIKNGLENLTINDLLKLFENKKQYSFFSLNLDKNYEENEFKVFFDEWKQLSERIKKIILDRENEVMYILTNDSLFEISELGSKLIHKNENWTDNEGIRDFCIDKNKNIYIASGDGIYKYEYLIDNKVKISDIKTEKIIVDNEGNIVFKKEESNFLYYLKNDEKFPINESEANLLRKISFSKFSFGKNLSFSSINVDSLNNLYLNWSGKLFLVLKYDIEPKQISGDFWETFNSGGKLNVVVKDNNFFSVKNKIYLFDSEGKLNYIKSGWTSAQQINIPKINDFYLDGKQENFYIATKQGIYKFNIEKNKSIKIHNINTPKLLIDKSNNIFFLKSGYLNILLKDKIYKIEPSVGSNIYEYPSSEKKYTGIIVNDKTIFVFWDNSSNNIQFKKTYFFNREDSWIDDEEKENDEILIKAKELEEERKDKEREEWHGEQGEKREKEWKINKLKEVEEYLKEQEKQGKLNSFEKKLLSCLSKHISDGFALGFGVLGGVIGTAIAPGAGTISGSTIGTAIGKWIGGIVGDSIQEAIPGEKSCKF